MLSPNRDPRRPEWTRVNRGCGGYAQNPFLRWSFTPLHQSKSRLNAIRMGPAGALACAPVLARGGHLHGARRAACGWAADGAGFAGTSTTPGDRRRRPSPSPRCAHNARHSRCCRLSCGPSRLRHCWSLGGSAWTLRFVTRGFACAPLQLVASSCHGLEPWIDGELRRWHRSAGACHLGARASPGEPRISS